MLICDLSSQKVKSPKRAIRVSGKLVTNQVHATLEPESEKADSIMKTVACPWYWRTNGHLRVSLHGHFARIALTTACGPEPGQVIFATSGRRMYSRTTLNASPRVVPVGTQ